MKIAAFVLCLTLAPLLATAALAHSYSGGAISIEHPWAAPTPPGAGVGAAYMTITNNGNTPVRLLGATTPAAAHVELHTMSVEGGVMRMRPMTGGAVIAPHGSFRFAPGGAHLMLIGLKKPLTLEEFIDLRLIFEGGKTLDVELYVEAAASHAH
jgi:hypothetical protein